MKNYDKNIISSYLEYLDASKLCGWGMIKEEINEHQNLIITQQTTFQKI